MFMIFVKVFLCKRKTSTVFSRLFVKVHSSMLYRNEYALLKSLIFTASVALLFSNICFRLLKARVVLLWMSFSVSTKIPRYLHSIHFFISIYLYFMVFCFVSFTSRFFIWALVVLLFSALFFCEVCDPSNVICILLIYYEGVAMG